jgi:F420-0:gamma-glutamyl ligase
MDDLIGRLVAHAGVDRTAAEKAAGVIVQFLSNEGSTEKVRALIRHMPGADAAMPASSSSLRSPRIGQSQAVTTETLTFSREKAGDDAVGKVVGALPSLGRFV